MNVFVYLVTPPQSTNTDLVINELMAANDNAVADNNGEFDDWIELHNKSNNTIDISGYYITDDQFNLTKHQIPQGTTITPNAYYVMWADEDGSQGSDHINFKLDADGEQIILVDTKS